MLEDLKEKVFQANLALSPMAGVGARAAGADAGTPPALGTAPPLAVAASRPGVT